MCPPTPIHDNNLLLLLCDFWSQDHVGFGRSLLLGIEPGKDIHTTPNMRRLLH